MSDEMAVTDNATGEDAKSNSEETATESAVEAEVAPTEVPPEPEDPPVKEDSATVPKEDDLFEKLKMLDSSNFPPLSSKDQEEELTEEKPELDPEPAVIDQTDGAAEKKEPVMKVEIDEEKRGVKRRASAAFSENGGEDFKGFDFANPSDLTDYSRVLKRLEAEVTAASKDFTPVRNVMATPSAPSRASKRARQDTDGSRPSSAMSSRSDEIVSSDVAASPLSRGRRTSEMSSPLLRVPLERGWRRELVYRAALDAHSRRNADIYYYSPTGKKLRSTREVSEQLSGTGLTLENFSFFKEPLGVDDPEKEIIRDAKMIRRVESPVAAAPPALEGKRAPKPKQPKGASPEPNTPNTPKSPPAKLKVKSVGSRLSGPPAPVAKPVAKKPAAAAADNNNSAAWKKPRPPQAVAAAATGSATVAATGSATGSATAVSVAVAATVASVANVATAVVTPPPPPLLSRPPLITSPEERCAPARQVVQPCSLTCGRGVPSLACAACLCLYHPYCAGHTHTDAPQPFYCKNCRKSTSPASEPPPLTHKSGVASAAALPAPVPRRVPVPVPVPVPKRPEKRVLLRMKAASGGPEGERVWAVAQAHAAAKPPPRASLPQSLVRLNGRRFIVVGRALVQPKAKSIDE